MNNEIKHSIELSTIEILNLRTACTLSKGLINQSSEWDALIDKLNNYLDELFNLK